VSRRIALLAAVFVLLASLLTWAGSAPSGADGPSATMTPDRNLTDGDIVTIRGMGWPPGDNIVSLECSGSMAALPKDTTFCDGFSADTTAVTNHQGSFVDAPPPPRQRSPTTGFRVFVLPNPRENGITIYCGPQHPCVLYVGVNFEDFKALHVFLPINFAPNARAAALGQRDRVLTSVPSSGGGSDTWVWAVIGVVVVVAIGGGVMRRRSRVA